METASGMRALRPFIQSLKEYLVKVLACGKQLQLTSGSILLLWSNVCLSPFNLIQPTDHNNIIIAVRNGRDEVIMPLKALEVKTA